MTQNIYDHEEFFEGYSRLCRSVEGLDGAPEWPALRALLPGLRGLKQHRTLATYVNMLLRLGFAISHVEEWGPTEEQIASRPNLADEHQLPPFLLVAARR